MVHAFAGDNVVINEATDSFQEDLSIEELFDQKTILIVTPEKLLYLLRRAPELAEQIGLVVYDEGHQFDSGARGVTYELFLTSLKLLLAPGTQIILISAVIANARALPNGFWVTLTWLWMAPAFFRPRAALHSRAGGIRSGGSNTWTPLTQRMSSSSSRA